MQNQIAHIDHLQIAAPEGCEAAAREFCGTLLGLKELEKPPALRGRGGCWFQCGPQQLHIGVESEFRPAKKAHPAFAVLNFDALRNSLLARGIRVVDDASIPSTPRLHAEDPWGNRLEFVQQQLRD